MSNELSTLAITRFVSNWLQILCILAEPVCACSSTTLGNCTTKNASAFPWMKINHDVYRYFQRTLLRALCHPIHPQPSSLLLKNHWFFTNESGESLRVWAPCISKPCRHLQEIPDVSHLRKKKKQLLSSTQADDRFIGF